MHATRAFYLSILLAVCACGDDGDASPRPLGGGCRADNDCQPGLACELGLCHQACTADSICPGAQRCVRGLVVDDAGTARHICQLDETTACEVALDCLGKQVCAGAECRDECIRTSDCSAEQTCRSDRCYSNDPAKDPADGGV